jgi:hypothetical protein
MAIAARAWPPLDAALDPIESEGTGKLREHLHFPLAPPARHSCQSPLAAAGGSSQTDSEHALSQVVGPPCRLTWLESGVAFIRRRSGTRAGLFEATARVVTSK